MLSRLAGLLDSGVRGNFGLTKLLVLKESFLALKFCVDSAPPAPAQPDHGRPPSAALEVVPDCEHRDALPPPTPSTGHEGPCAHEGVPAPTDSLRGEPAGGALQ